MTVIFAGITNIPIAFGIFGSIVCLLQVYLWNILINIFMPQLRKSMNETRSVNRVFTKDYLLKKNNNNLAKNPEQKNINSFKEALEQFKKQKNDPIKNIANTAFNIIAGEDKIIQIEEIQELFESWGMTNPPDASYQVFGKNAKDIDFKTFEKRMH